jgi:hypothetical protein
MRGLSNFPAMRALAVNNEVEKYFFGIQNRHCKLLAMLKLKAGD